MTQQKQEKKEEGKNESPQSTPPKEVPHPQMKRGTREKMFDKESWQPKTKIGEQVKAGEIASLDMLLDKGISVMEAEIVDTLLPSLQSDLLAVGQSKGKFGGGKRSIWRQTQKKTSEGNKPKFSAVVVVGNKNGYVGVGLGKAKETVPAREKAFRRAKLNVIKIRRGCGSWACGCATPHSIPFKVRGKCGSVTMELIPAPKGTDLCVEKECKKILQLAGIKDIYSQTYGHTKTKINLIKACVDALLNLSAIKIQPEHIKICGIHEGSI